MFHYIYKIYIFTIILCASNLFKDNGVEIGTYKLSYHNGGIQFRMLAQKNANKKSFGNTLMKILLKDNKTKNIDPQISSVVNLVDNMNITQEKKNQIKTLTLKYIKSDNIKEKNKLINEIKKYSKNKECKKNMNNYLMYLRMQDDIKYLERINILNYIWVVTITFLLIILSLVVLCSASYYGLATFLFTCILSSLMIYILAPFFPEIKIYVKKIKRTCKNYFNKKTK
ncbi:Pfmc-2TM Maurer's cleft two transmembrane, putative [Plasmodium sp. gorilla clade G1]|nr:Pfmc-2TM Maurer's cleft two transmembrane, putative [Plasmodium sp. gorilla clade G1]